MKKLISVLLVVVLFATLFAGCGKTDATKNVQTLIATAVENVNLDSKAALDEARKAYNALSEEEKAKVKNYSKLEKAEEEYKSYVTFNDDIATIVNAAETGFSKDETNISTCIKKAEEILGEYQKMSAARKEMVKDIDKVENAKAVLVGYEENAVKAAAQYVKAFYNTNSDKRCTVTAVYCIKQIRNETDEYQLFALTYKDTNDKETTVYSHARCSSDVSAAVIAKRPDTFFAAEPANASTDAKEKGNVTLDLQKVLELAK